nr:type 2 lanthipeptide synthetase LanM family protein [Xenococcaceae cyanobacterium MO_188.B19]
KYSVLGKLVATTIDLWIDATSEFISRLTKDWVQIEQSFSPKQALKQVTEIKTGLSDPHNGRRSVMILTFDTGMKLVYKPKDLAIEAAFFQFLDWFNQQGQLLPFKVIQVLNYGSHGWVEYVESLPCNNEKEVQGFYQRSGMLLCLIQILEGTDCHYDNLIANGEQPVLIDTETLLHPHNKTPDAIDRSKVQILANKKLTESPLRTLMLPQWGLSANDDLNMDLSGLGGRDEQKELTLKWKNINTDGMNLETELVTVKEGNAPTLNQTPLTPDKYLAHLILGFEQMYRFLSNSKDILLAPNSPLTIFANLKVRYLFRTTRTYDSILHDSFTPELLQSGIDRSIALDVLSRAFLLQEAKPDFWDILEAELQAMEGLDIPFFSVKTSETSLKLSTGVVIPNLFEEPSYQRVITRIKSLSEQDLKEQLEIIRGSFCARFMKQPEMNNSGNQDDLELLSEYTSLTSEQLVQESINIGQELKQWAIDAEDSVTWIGLGLRGDSQSFQLQSLSHNLYDGSSGVALFLAALAKVTGNSDWRDLALKTLHPLRYQLQNMTPQAIKQLKRLGISGATGLGSIVYALVQISDLLDEPDLIVNAKKIASLITLDLIAADRTFNIIGGAAGTILACLKLSEFEPSALGKAIACGEHLLMLVSSQQLNVIADGETGRQGDREIFSVNSSDKLALKIGFAQGLAGIAYALLKLFAVTQDKRFLEGAEKAIAYEQNYVTNIEALAHHNSWASGFAGIALGRLGSLSILDSKAIRKDIISALDITQKHCLEDIDNLAWGNLGRLETLLVASEKLNRPDLLHFGLQATTYLVKQAQARGRFNLVSSSVPFAYNPGFFQGTTGIGYQLLRMAYPQLLPSVLLWN